MHIYLCLSNLAANLTRRFLSKLTFSINPEESRKLSTMPSEKPTILLIPGAWHQANTFEAVATILRAKGYPVQTMTLLSVGGLTSATVADDAEDIRQKYLRKLVTEGKEVIVVMHSYSGIPGTESIKGFAQKDLAAQGKKGGVVGLVYITAFLVAAGASVASILGEYIDFAMTFDV
jgi:vacuolar-type H+-ATPase subunit F/Vma7